MGSDELEAAADRAALAAILESRGRSREARETLLDVLSTLEAVLGPDHYEVGEDVALAVSEAATNAVLHAHRGDEAKGMRVVACARQTGLVVVVRDYGVGMSPNPDSPGPGLGLSVIGALAAEVNIERPGDGGTRVRIRFPLAA